jgi:plastocyanin
MRKTVLLGTAALVAASTLAVAADHLVTQKGRLFSVDSITIKKGDSITFLNDDTVPHNIMSVSSGNEFNLGSQQPGSSTPVTFNTVGEFNVICAIHPRMKLDVQVTN